MENSARNRRVLGGVAGVTLALAVAVSAGAVPRPGDSGNGKTIAASSQFEEIAAPPARQPNAPVVDVTEAPATTIAVAPTTAAPTTAPPTTAPKATTPTTKAPAKATVAATPTTVAAAPVVVPTVPALPVTVPRRVPSAAEVQQAIATFPQYIHTILTPSPAQVAQLGDQICTAFDQGQTFAQVKATGLSMVTQIPLTTVLPGGADWVVKTGVTLYCPGHASKLV